MKENNKIVFNYVKENEANDITAKDIAEATGIPVKSVNGIVTSAFQRKGMNMLLYIFVNIQAKENACLYNCMMKKHFLFMVQC